MNTSQPRTLSANRGRISPLANCDDVGLAERLTEMGGHLLRQGGVRPPREQSELLGGDLLHVVAPPRACGGRIGVAGSLISRRHLQCRTLRSTVPAATVEPAGRWANGPTVAAVADLGVDADGVAHHAVAPDDAVGELGVRAEVGAVADDRLALQDRARVDRDVAAELDRDVDERLARVEHRDAVEQPAPVGAVAELALGERELPAVVDALGLARPAPARRRPGGPIAASPSITSVR